MLKSQHVLYCVDLSPTLTKWIFVSEVVYVVLQLSRYTNSLISLSCGLKNVIHAALCYSQSYVLVVVFRWDF